MLFFYILLSSLFLFYIFIVIKRLKKYKYNQNKDYKYKLDKNFLKKTSIQNNYILLDDSDLFYDTLLIKVEIIKSFSSLFFKPYILIEGSTHYFEYGASGIRYLNISQLNKDKLLIVCKHTKLKSNELEIYGYKNNIDLMTQNILILAPHADDAEIAAFGLYKSAKNITIITTTIGEDGVCNYCALYNNNKLKNSIKKAELRTLDALSVPLLGGVPIQNNLTLGYFGSSLKWMNTNPEKEACSQIEGFYKSNDFRKVSHATIKLEKMLIPTHTAFISDLQKVIEQLCPDIIVTPHPTIDSHPDHKYTTIGLLESLSQLDYDCKLLMYTNHLNISETYPIGKRSSSVSLPPNQEAFYFNSIYSFHLTAELQVDKFFALESIHDLRDSLVSLSPYKAYSYTLKKVKRILFGKDKSYYQRAIRSQELFFVTDARAFWKHYK